VVEGIQPSPAAANDAFRGEARAGVRVGAGTTEASVFLALG
jgi:hypothetical protein